LSTGPVVFAGKLSHLTLPIFEITVEKQPQGQLYYRNEQVFSPVFNGNCRFCPGFLL